MSGYKYFAFIRKRHKLKYYLKTRFVRKIPRRISFLKRPKWKRVQRVLLKGQRPYKKYFYDYKQKENRSNAIHKYCKKFKLLQSKFCFHKQIKKFHRRKRRHIAWLRRHGKKKYRKKKYTSRKRKITKIIKFKHLIILSSVNIRQNFFYEMNYKHNFDTIDISKKIFMIKFIHNMKNILNNYKIYNNLKQTKYKKIFNFYNQIFKKYNIEKNYNILLFKNKKIIKNTFLQKNLYKKIFKNKYSFKLRNLKLKKKIFLNLIKKRIKLSFVIRRKYNKKRFKFKKYLFKWKRKIDVEKIWPKSKKRPFLHEPFLITRGIRVKKQPKKLSRSFRKNRMHEKATKLDFNMVSKKGGKDKIIRHLDMAKNRFFYMFYKIDYLLRHFNYCVSQYHAVRRMNLAEVNSLQKRVHPLIYVEKDMLITVNSLDYNRRINRKKFFKKWQYLGSFIVHDTYSQTFTVIKPLDDLSIEDLRLLNVKRSFINIHKLK